MTENENVDAKQALKETPVDMHTYSSTGPQSVKQNSQLPIEKEKPANSLMEQKAQFEQWKQIQFNEVHQHYIKLEEWQKQVTLTLHAEKEQLKGKETKLAENYKQFRQWQQEQIQQLEERKKAAEAHIIQLQQESQQLYLKNEALQKQLILDKENAKQQANAERQELANWKAKQHQTNDRYRDKMQAKLEQGQKELDLANEDLQKKAQAQEQDIKQRVEKLNHLFQQITSTLLEAQKFLGSFSVGW